MKVSSGVLLVVIGLLLLILAQRGGLSCFTWFGQCLAASATTGAKWPDAGTKGKGKP